MSTETTPNPRVSDTGDSEIVHTYCDCDRDLALCGEDLTGADLQGDDDIPCVVCEDLIDVPCERCGAP